jgi:hypothetical protein
MSECLLLFGLWLRIARPFFDSVADSDRRDRYFIGARTSGMKITDP